MKGFLDKWKYPLLGAALLSTGGPLFVQLRTMPTGIVPASAQTGAGWIYLLGDALLGLLYFALLYRGFKAYVVRKPNGRSNVSNQPDRQYHRFYGTVVSLIILIQAALVVTKIHDLQGADESVMMIGQVLALALIGFLVGLYLRSLFASRGKPQSA